MSALADTDAVGGEVAVALSGRLLAVLMLGAIGWVLVGCTEPSDESREEPGSESADQPVATLRLPGGGHEVNVFADVTRTPGTGFALTSGSLPIEPGGRVVLVVSADSASSDLARAVQRLHPGDEIMLQSADEEPVTFRVHSRDILPAGRVLGVGMSHGRPPAVLSLLVEDYEDTNGLVVTALWRADSEAEATWTSQAEPTPSRNCSSAGDPLTDLTEDSPHPYRYGAVRVADGCRIARSALVYNDPGIGWCSRHNAEIVISGALGPGFEGDFGPVSFVEVEPAEVEELRVPEDAVDSGLTIQGARLFHDEADRTGVHDLWLQETSQDKVHHFVRQAPGCV